MLEQGTNVNKQATSGNYRTPLIAAVSAGKLEILKVFLKRRANVNAKVGSVDLPTDFTTTLLTAAQAVDVRAVFLLLKHNADQAILDDYHKLGRDWSEHPPHILGDVDLRDVDSFAKDLSEGAASTRYPILGDTLKELDIILREAPIEDGGHRESLTKSFIIRENLIGRLSSDNVLQYSSSSADVKSS